MAGKSSAAAGKTGSRPRKPRTAAALTRIDVDLRREIAVVTLNRPEVHNAFDQTLIRELTAALKRLDRDRSVRAVVLAGAGKSFCAGADLNWMREMATYSRARNLADANALARMLATLSRMSKPTIARVHGAAYGGGVGLVACCDIAFGALESTFRPVGGAAGPHPRDGRPVRGRGDRRTRGAALFSDRRALRRRGSAPPGLAARHRRAAASSTRASTMFSARC